MDPGGITGAGCIRPELAMELDLQGEELLERGHDGASGVMVGGMYVCAVYLPGNGRPVGAGQGTNIGWAQPATPLLKGRRPPELLPGGARRLPPRLASWGISSLPADRFEGIVRWPS